ncbi:hypothetical protein FGB62_205g06 [Gracilaria domingensis]|nr:hypothetical protein FGB62_205g06 [Gracilaria domingensis]
MANIPGVQSEACTVNFILQGLTADQRFGHQATNMLLNARPTTINEIQLKRKEYERLLQRQINSESTYTPFRPSSSRPRGRGRGRGRDPGRGCGSRFPNTQVTDMLQKLSTKIEELQADTKSRKPRGSRSRANAAQREPELSDEAFRALLAAADS